MSDNSQKKLKKRIILGAGFSYALGYPLGSELLKDIEDFYKFLKSDNSITDIHEKKKEEFKSKIGIDNLETLLRTLSEFPDESIDSTISKLPKEFIEKVELKKVMWTIVTSYQHYHDDSNGGCYNKMYRKFANNLLPSLESGDKDNLLNIVKKHLENNPIQIITFNYDVSLEYYLLRFIKSQYAENVSNDIQDDIFKEICKTIHHVYGSLRDIDFMITEGVNYTNTRQLQDFFNGRISETRGVSEHLYYAYFANNVSRNSNPDNMENSKYNTCYEILTQLDCIKKEEWDGIKLIGEERNDRIATNVKNLLKTPSEETYILGFGFDKTNSTTILGFDENGKDKNLHGEIYITNFGNNIRIAKLINKYFGSGLATVSYNSACDALQTEFPLS